MFWDIFCLVGFLSIKSFPLIFVSFITIFRATFRIQFIAPLTSESKSEAGEGNHHDFSVNHQKLREFDINHQKIKDFRILHSPRILRVRSSY